MTQSEAAAEARRRNIIEPIPNLKAIAIRAKDADVWTVAYTTDQ